MTDQFELPNCDRTKLVCPAATAMVEEIGRLKEERDARVSVQLLNVERETCDRIRSDNDRLRALNAELREKATALCEELHEQGHGGHPPHNYECAICFTLDNLRAILAKSHHPSTSAQEAAS